MSKNDQPTLLVTGASGQLGQRVVELLLEANAGTIVATTRTPEKLANLAEKGVIVRHADFNQPDSLPEAFAGVDRLLIISTDSLEKPGLRVTQHQAAIKAAEAAGVSHVVYTSVVNPGPGSVIPDHYETEEALAASQLNWTILRNNLYADLLPSTIGQAIQMGQLFSAAGDGRLAYISREDCAQAAAAALLSSFDGRKTLNITGAEALSPADLADLASNMAGKPVTYVPLTKDELINNMVAAGVPEPAAQFVGALDAATARGQFDVLSDDFAELTGRKPTAVADFLAAN
ncbi:MAG: SDR family oxidoreductase [Ardenticatenaceae bacterium]|nr:SDR family oxidoreductase [Ardenticatenaceae bacterium]MCB8947125.1 SDR family oxidoreductase [Ardenticatenaceae bacterium]